MSTGTVRMMDNFLILSEEEVQSRKEMMHNEILALWSAIPGYHTYYVQCRCAFDCDCVGDNEIPRLRLSACYYYAEFNILLIEQPFVAVQGFKYFGVALVMTVKMNLLVVKTRTR